MKHTQYAKYHTYSRQTVRNAKAQVFQNPTTHLHKSQVIFTVGTYRISYPINQSINQLINHKIKAPKVNEIRIN